MKLIREYIRDLKQEFQGYSRGAFAKDVMAGLTVTAVALPLALAFGVSSGADAAAGLITAIIGGFVMSLLSGGYYQISGPTGAMAAILISVVSQYGLQGVFLATLIAGVILVLAGVFRLGRLASFIPMPVIAGFTSGIAVIIALGQIDNFFGTVSSGESAIAKLFSYGQLGFSPDWITVLIGVVSVVLIAVYPKKWSAIIPGSLVVIVLATAASMIFHLPVKTVGEIPQTLMPANRLSFSALSWQSVTGVLGPAVSIALLGMIESLMCGASAGRMTGVRLRSDRELISQGVGNILVPFFGGIPATAAIARTSVAIKSGAKTRVAGMVHSVGLLASMLLLAPVMSNIPLAALAGVLMVTAWRMNDWAAIKHIFRGRFKRSIVEFSVTMVATVAFDLVVAIAVGVAISLVFLVARLSKLQVAYDRVDIARLGTDDPAIQQRHQDTLVVYINGPIIFANTQKVEEIDTKLEGIKTVLLSMRGVSELDISGAQILYDMVAAWKARGIDVMFSGVPEAAKRMMDRQGITALAGDNSFYWSAARALCDLRPFPEDQEKGA